MLAACGGSDDGVSNEPGISYRIEGAAVKGPLANASVHIYSVDLSNQDFKGDLIAIASTDDSAQIDNLALTPPLEPFYILEFSANAQTRDINTGVAPLVPVLRTVVTEAMLTDGQFIYATLLTTMATDIAIANADSNVPPFNGDNNGISTISEFANALEPAAAQVMSVVGFGVSTEVDLWRSSPIIYSYTNNASRQAVAAHYRSANEALTALLFHLGQSVLPVRSSEDVLNSLTADLIFDGVINANPPSANVAASWLDLMSTVVITDLPIPGTSNAANGGNPYSVNESELLMQQELQITGYNVDARFIDINTAVPGSVVLNSNLDADIFPNFTDNCPGISNNDQADLDSDGQGDVCDTDDDNDTVADDLDNCPRVPNSNQLNTDGDAQGNACDTDDDADGVLDELDNCPVDANTNQLDTDLDGLGDACDGDDDNDTVADAQDNCPLIANTGQENNDGDSQGDICDSDDDNDTVVDASDNCPLLANLNQSDIDGDGQGDACDPDNDNDLVLDELDNCPALANVAQIDTDSDGVGDVCDSDRDGDSIANSADNCTLVANPNQLDTNGDNVGDACESVWHVSNGMSGGEAHAIAVDPTDSNTVYAGTPTGGLYKSNDGGGNWVASNKNLGSNGVWGIGVDPVTPNIVYIATSTGIYKSNDNGLNWRAVNAGLSGVSMRLITLDPQVPTTLYAGGTELYKSSNGGMVWNRVGPANLDLRTVVVDPSDSNIVYAGAFSGVHKSVDGGIQWQTVNSGMDPINLNVTDLIINPISPVIMYVSIWTGGVFKTTDAAASWTRVSTATMNTNIYSLALNPSNPSTVYIGGVNIYKSSNAGTSWENVRAGVGAGYAKATAVDPQNGAVYVGTISRRHGMIKSENDGLSWVSINSGFSNVGINTFAVDPANASIVYAGSDNMGLYKSTDAGANWVLLGGMLTYGVNAIVIDPQNSAFVYALSVNGVLRSSDAGASWEEINSSMVNSKALLLVASVPQTLFLGRENGVFVSSDGVTWTARNTGLTNLDVQVLEYNTTSGVLYAGTTGGVFSSSDSGANWVARSVGLSNGLIQDIKLDPVNPAVMYAATTSGLFRSVDSGANWAAYGGLNANVMKIAIDPGTPTTLYAATQSRGVFRSLDSGATWGPYNTGVDTLYSKSVVVLPSTPARTLLGTAGNGVYRQLN